MWKWASHHGKKSVVRVGAQPPTRMHFIHELQAEFGQQIIDEMHFIHELQAEFGQGLSDLSMDGNNYNKENAYGIRVTFWKEREDGEWDDGITVSSKGSTIEEAKELLKTKLRLLA